MYNTYSLCDQAIVLICSHVNMTTNNVIITNVININNVTSINISITIIMQSGKQASSQAAKAVNQPTR